MKLPIYKSLRQFILLILCFLALVSCRKSESDKHLIVDAGFGDYVSAFSSGIVSSRSNVKIVLAQPLSNIREGQILKEGIITLKPSVDGQAVWLDNQSIEFRPTNKLRSGETYKVEFKLSELMEVEEKFETMTFAFTVIRQNLFVSIDKLKTADINDLTNQEMYGTLRTNDIALNAEIEKCLTASQGNSKLIINWIHQKDSKVHKFIIKNIERGNSESFVKLKWNAEALGIDIKSQREQRIPPLGEFTLMQISTQREPGLHFSITLSDPIKQNQDLTGLVYLKSGKNLRLKIEENEIKAFPLNDLSNTETIVIDKSIENSLGHQLQETYERIVEFKLVEPAVELIGDGVIMPSSGNITFPFKAVNLKAINLRIIQIYEDNVPQFMQENQIDGSNQLARVGNLVYDGTIDLISEEPIDYSIWNNFSIDLSNLIQPQAGTIYRIMISYERYQSLYPCGSEEEVKPMKKNKLNFVDGRSYFSPNDWYEGYIDWDEKDNPCSESYYRYYNRAISANIIASNLGILAKESSENHFNVVVTDLRNSDAISGTQIIALDYQHQEVGEAKTNSDGLAQFKTKRKPYLLLAKKGDQKGYLRVDNGSALSVSLFEVGGDDIKKGIKGFIYGERDVWRPGDTLHLTFMLEDKLNALPETHPIVLEMYDPKGKLYEKQVKNKGVKGLYYFKIKTAQSDITGNWQVRIMVGNSTFYKYCKLETIKPNRLKIDLNFDKILHSNKTIKTRLNAKWLYGLPGANLKAEVEYNLANLNTTFEGYENYQFDDRSKRYYDSDVAEVSGTTNNSGDVDFTFPVQKPNNAPGMLQLKFRTKVFEPGGDFSQDFLSVPYSPYRSYAGLKVDAGQNWMNALNTEEEQAISLASVDEHGNPINSRIKLKVYKMGWRWWWEGNGSDELTQYINAYDKELIKEDLIEISNGKSVYGLKFDKPDWGRMLIVIEDIVSGHSASQLVYADYPGWWSSDGSGSEAASMLAIEAGKTKYDVGEKIDVSVPSGGVGNIYVTLEKGDKILKQFWVKAEKESTQFSFEASKEMAPNVYISATLIQPHAQKENSLPIRVYGVIPVYVNDPNTHVSPEIKAPKEIRPESTFSLEVSEKDGKAMAYTVAVVDEGLLSLTRFKTPNPWKTFYSKEALKVRTWDLYQYVMSAKTGKLIPLLAVGGDEALKIENDQEAQRFKAVVKYLGPFYLKEGKSKRHEISIPNYIGALRVMVVAGNEGAYGSAEKEVLVKQPLMVMSTLPRVLGPSEKIRVPVNVISMIDKAQSIKVKVSSNDMLKVIGPDTRELRIEEAGEETVYFEYEIARRLGKATFRVDVNSGKNKAFEELELNVRAPNPHISAVKSNAVEPGNNWELNYEAIGIKGSNSATFSVSKIPDIALKKQLDYLIKYPHGCIEQTTSSAFPQLFLSQLVELSAIQKEKIQNNVLAAINRLRKFQTQEGGMTYWPGNSNYISEWGTNYAGHFMLEAKEKGYDIPPGVLSQWIKFQKTAASNWTRARYDQYGRYGGDLTQAYRLFTLALAGQPDIGAMNRLKNDARLSNTGAWRLSAAYAILGREEAAKQLAEREIIINPYRETGFTFGSNLRDQAMIIETMAYLKENARGAELIRDLAKELKKGWHSTQTRAYALLAISKFISGDDFPGEISVSLNVNGKNFSVNTDVPIYQLELSDKELNSGRIEFQNNSSQLLFVNFIQSGIPLEINQNAIRDDLNMEINYYTMDNRPLDVRKIKQGQDFKAEIKIKHPGIRSSYQEVALNQIFPSGWQIINTRLNEESTSNKNYNYQDIRDDRIYTYFDLGKSKTVYFEVLLNASFCGEFYQPGVFCAPMYDESIQALDPGQWVEVIP